MTVHLHHTISSAARGDVIFLRDDPKRDISKDTERTWAFDDDAATESWVISHVQLAAGTDIGVPLTHDEQEEAKHIERRSKGVVAELVEGLVGAAERETKKAARAPKEAARAPKTVAASADE